ncbi:slipin family protein [Berryella wangjianweii]|uniref:Slipin family protein n=1 Tax=Berryella wangjianweii TaxID=2734634 RepID=A0A6M8J0M6_9ACTN|nr:slipin family protein [Berryella wangjianweii]
MLTATQRRPRRPRASSGSTESGRSVALPAESVRAGTTRVGAVLFALTMFAAGFGATVLGAFLAGGGFELPVLVVAALVGWLCASSIHVVLQWERAVILRFGRFNRTSGPGVVLTLPIIEFYTVRIDQRVSATYFGAEETLTRDLVPVNVDAVLFWMVFDPEKAALEVEDYAAAVSWVAQTAMRKAIGRNTVVEVATRRQELDDELKAEIERKLHPWGIDIIDVELRDIVIPKELQEAMARSAVAEREKEARTVLAEVERDIAEMLSDAAEVYEGSAEALRLRTMHLAYESVKSSGGTVMMPSAFSEGFVDAPRRAEAAGEAAGAGAGLGVGGASGA